MATSQEQLIVKISADVTKLQQQLKQAENRVNQSSNNMISSVKRFAGMVGTYLSVRQLVNYGDSWTNINSKIRLVTDSTAELNVIQRELVNLAKSTRSDLDGTVTLYSKMYKATRELGYSQSELLSITKTINQAMIVSGASSIEASSALLQLSQGLASGTLRGEELNSVMENTPRLAQAIANGMNITTGELRAMGAEGKITSQTIIEALKSQSEVIQNEYKTMPMTVSQSMENMKTTMIEAIGSVDTAFGGTSGLAGTIQNASEAISNNIGNITKTINDILPYVTKIAQAFIAFKGTVLLVNTAISAYTAVATMARNITISWGNAFKGIAFIGIATAIGEMVGLFDKYDYSVSSSTETTEQFTNSLKKLSSAQLELTKFKIADQIVSQTESMRSARLELAKLSSQGLGFKDEEFKRAKANYKALRDELDLLKNKELELANYTVEYERLKKEAKERTNRQISTNTTGLLMMKDSINENYTAFTNIVGLAENIGSSIGKSIEEATDAMKKSEKATEEWAKKLDSVKSTVESGLSSAFRQSLDGAVNWGDTFKGILKDVLAQMFKVYVLQQALGTGTVGTGSSTSPITTAYAGPSAKGNVVTSTGYDKAFAKGGVVDSPTLFGMGGNQTGLMGEAGAEAIMPLGRMANGDLGVQGVALNVNVINNAGVDVQTSQDGMDFNIMIEKMDNALADGVRRQTNSLSQAIKGMK